MGWNGMEIIYVVSCEGSLFLFRGNNIHRQQLPYLANTTGTFLFFASPESVIIDCLPEGRGRGGRLLRVANKLSSLLSSLLTYFPDVAQDWKENGRSRPRAAGGGGSSSSRQANTTGGGASGASPPQPQIPPAQQAAEDDGEGGRLVRRLCPRCICMVMFSKFWWQS